MKPNRSPILLLGILVAAGSIALRAETSEPELLSVRIVPEAVELEGAGATRQLLVMGSYSDRLERDVTSLSRWEFSDAGVATVSPGGEAEALAEGTTDLTARLGALSVTARLQVKGGAGRPPLSFAWDVERVLTRRGCNDSHCHGGVKGRGGFKLSLYGIYPEEDYRWIVRGGTYQVLSPDPGTEIPRIDREEPEKSLLLRKPSLAEPHQGGLQLPLESDDYKTLLRWVKEGAPFQPAAASRPGVRAIEVYPAEAVLEVGGGQQLLVSALLENGTRKDLTGQVRYLSDNSDVAEVEPDGRLRGLRPGETFVTVRTAGHSTTARVSVIEATLARYPGVPANNFIDRLVFDKLSRLHRIPSELSGDAEFLRRVCLDLTGTLPPPRRTREFLTSSDPAKREKLVDTILQTPEFVDYWTYRLSQLFRVALFENGINLQWTEAYWEWIRGHVAANTPYDRMARERIAAIGYSAPSRHFLPNGEVRYPQNKMAEEVRVFMGRRLDCAECHNHPFEAWSQDQFWGLAAFFGRMNLVGGRGEEVGTVIFEDPTGQEVDLFVKGRSRKVLHPRTREEVFPAFLNGSLLPETDWADPRVKLAQWITAHPYFAEAAVNRIWSYFFGRGIVEPVDDFRAANPPTHPRLLAALAKDFREHDHDLRRMIRTIVGSRTYQLSSRPNRTNREDRTHYSHALPRALDAEVLFDAIATVTGVPLILEQESYGDGEGRLPPGTRAINVKLPDVFRSRILDNYGKAPRSMLPEKRPRPNLSRALHSLAGTTFTEHLAREGGIIDRLMDGGGSDREIIEELYLRALVRLPGEEEREQLEAMVGRHPSRRRALEDLLWGLLNSPEFYHNH
ncbi:MAG: DUF1553 domain-containing protein [Acidobacteriota bacterium]|nr:DUF1553 domain-containing protein [Acidobacteriota bacterium]